MKVRAGRVPAMLDLSAGFDGEAMPDGKGLIREVQHDAPPSWVFGSVLDDADRTVEFGGDEVKISVFIEISKGR